MIATTMPVSGDVLSPQTSIDSSSECDITTCMTFKDTELTLGLPGGAARSPVAVSAVKPCMKRGFIETTDFSDHGPKPDPGMSHSDRVLHTAKAQVVGWPPVRSFRKKTQEIGCKLIKVAVDGAPYLRKVDLDMYSSYEELLEALEKMFSCFTISNNYEEERKLVDSLTGTEYMPTYEDRDGDWMLVGDVPWKMFVESCKRIRLKKNTEAVEVGLGNA